MLVALASSAIGRAARLISSIDVVIPTDPIASTQGVCVKKTYQFLLCAGTLLVTPLTHADNTSRISCFTTTYPTFIKSVKKDPTDGKLYFYMSNGKKLLWNDGVKKTFQLKLNNPDLEDMVSLTYPNGRNVNTQPAVDDDPGRFRNSTFLQSVYGGSQSAVEQNLVDVIWPTTENKKSIVRFNKKNGAAKALYAVAAELLKLPPYYRKYIYPAQTFKWRVIAGTNRLSPHSFGIAMDINTKHSHYWRWTPGNNLTGGKIKFINKEPAAIIDIFERHGFIWGGRWYHYDTMHFEYRPELLQPKCIRRSKS